MSEEKFSDRRVRTALTYLLYSLTNCYNEYGAGGAWGGAPIPLFEIGKRLDCCEQILLNGIDDLVQEGKLEDVARGIGEKYHDVELLTRKVWILESFINKDDLEGAREWLNKEIKHNV